MIISKRYVIKINYGVSFHPYTMLGARIPASPKQLLTNQKPNN